jgi:hypothetical protein
MKITPLKKAQEIISEFEAIIEKDCMAFNEVYQILRLSGMPQYQIVFWRSVEEHLKNIQLQLK